MSEVELLQDYRTIYQEILDPIKEANPDILLEKLTANQINEFTAQISEGKDDLDSATKALSYITNIQNILVNLGDLPTGQDDEEDLDYDEKSKLQLKEETIKRKRRSLKLLQLSLILIFGGLGMFILIKTFRNFSKNRKKSKTDDINSVNSLIKYNEEKQAVYYSLIDNICYSLVLFYIVYLIRFNFKYYIELINLEYDNYKSVKNIEIKNIHSALTNIKTIVDKIICIKNNSCGDSSSSTTSTTVPTAMEEYYNKRGSLASYIIIFNDNYLKLDKALIDNKLAKEEKIQDINVIFNNYKDIIYKQNNKFDNIVVDNEKHVVCLMNILLYKGVNDNVSEDIVCNLNNSDGLIGLIEKNKINIDDEADGTNTVIFNGLENIGIDAADSLYELFTGNTLDESNKFELLNNPLFNVILNIFK